jgi:hypothetical protein
VLPNDHLGNSACNSLKRKVAKIPASIFSQVAPQSSTDAADAQGGAMTIGAPWVVSKSGDSVTGERRVSCFRDEKLLPDFPPGLV